MASKTNSIDAQMAHMANIDPETDPEWQKNQRTCGLAKKRWKNYQKVVLF